MDTAVSTTPRSDTLWGAVVSGVYASAATAMLAGNVAAAVTMTWVLGSGLALGSTPEGRRWARASC